MTHFFSHHADVALLTTAQQARGTHAPRNSSPFTQSWNSPALPLLLLNARGCNNHPVRNVGHKSNAARAKFSSRSPRSPSCDIHLIFGGRKHLVLEVFYSPERAVEVCVGVTPLLLFVLPSTFGGSRRAKSRRPSRFPEGKRRKPRSRVCGAAGNHKRQAL